NSDYIRRFFYNHPCFSHSMNKARIIWIKTTMFFLPGKVTSHLRACFNAILLLVLLVPKLFGGC
ncbi:MAG: hypothetical protein LGB55_07250, partial [Sulfurovum sp.]|nr:hypothetical protein [Sulfurovum sp.]